MALQVWLPLNGNSNNYGLADDLILTSGTAMYKVGKIGQGLDLNSRIYFNCQTLSGLTKFSVAFWAKVEDNTSLTTNWQDIIGFTDQKADNSATGQIRAETCYNYSPGTGIHWHDNTTYAIERDDSSANHYSGDRGIWHHCVLAVDSSVGCSVYTDGNLIKTTNNPQGGHITGVFWLGETNNIAGCINDVRIYDHVLSPREVAELAKGLVLHYPLGDSYIEGTTNLAPTDGYGITTTCYNAATSKYGYGADTDMYREIGDYEGRHCTRVRMGTSGLSAYPYVYFNNQTNVGETKTLSFDYFPSANSGRNKISFYRLSTDVSITYEVNGVKGTASNWTGWLDVKLGQWNHIVITGENVGSANGGLGYMQIGPDSHTSSTDYYWLFSNVQVELKDHATGYTPPGTTRAGGEVYDTSGYGNNGTVNGTLVVSSDSPRYNASTQIDGSRITCASGLVSVADPVFSVSLWFRLKSNTSYTAYQDLISFASPSYSNQPFRLEICGSPVGNDIYWFRGPTGSVGGFKVNNTALSRDVWYYTVLVSEGNKQYSYYMNGVKQGTYDGSANTWTPTGSVTIGDSIAGKIDMSDFRIYATVLTADQVKQLYEAPISLADNGTLFANEFNET